MNTDGKKISFSFSKLSKKPSTLPSSQTKDETVELIDSLEDAQIKVKNVIEKVEITPLVIPMRGNSNNILSRIEEGSTKRNKLNTKIENEDSRPDSELTIEELAARQLLQEARNKLSGSKETQQGYVLPLTTNTTGQVGIGPSMDDYENVPIEGFGLALVRGMGGKEEMSNQSNFIAPDRRSYGLGLGAEKSDVKSKDIVDKNGKPLVLKGGAFAKIISGPHKGKFCEVQFCDQWTGRVDVKTSNTNEELNLNELFLVPITKEEYISGSKVINNAKYEQYKEMERFPKTEENFDEKTSKSSPEENKSESDDSDMKRTENSSGHAKLNMESKKLILKQESFDTKASSDDEYDKKKNKQSDKGTEKLYKNTKHEDQGSSSKHKSRVGYDRRYKKDSSEENTRHRSRKSSNSRSRENYVKEKSRTKKRHSSSESSEDYNSRRYERTNKDRIRRSRSRESPVYYSKKKSNRSRSSSSEDRGKYKSKSKYKNRSRSSSTEYKKKSISKNEKYSTKKKKNKKDYEHEEKRYSRKHKQSSDSE